MIITLFALFILICVHYCNDVIAVVAEINSIQKSYSKPHFLLYPLVSSSSGIGLHVAHIGTLNTVTEVQ